MRQHITQCIVWARTSRVQIIRYLLTGFSAVFLDWGVYVTLTRVCGVDILVAQCVSTLMGSIYVFIVNKMWSFGVTHDTGKQARRYVVIASWNWVFQQVMFYLATIHGGFHDLLVKILVTGCIVSWNFLLYKYWVYATHQ